jgi:hypothetical protein
MPYNTHDYGDLVRLATYDPTDASPTDGFRDELLGGLIDPDVVKLSVRTPAGTVTTYEYGEDAGVEKDDVGQYHADITVDEKGTWHYRWWSTGDGQASEERHFTVRAARTAEA